MLKYRIGDITNEDNVDQEEVLPVDEGGQKWMKTAKLTKKREVSHNSSIFTFKFNEEFNLDLKPG